MKKILFVIIATLGAAIFVTSCESTDNPINERTIQIPESMAGDTIVYQMRDDDFHQVPVNFIVEPLYDGEGSIAFAFNTWEKISWKISDVPEFLKVSPREGVGSGWFYVTFYENPTGKSRQGKFYFKLSERDSTNKVRTTVTHTITVRQR